MFRILAALTLLALVGCAETTVTPLSRNQIMLSTSAEAMCGSAGSAKVASKMAAVETLRHGFERYIIAGAGSANNTSIISTGPTYAHTTGDAYGSSTYFGGAQVLMTGTYDSQLHVIMFNTGDKGFDQAIDARKALGPDWKKISEKGVNTCS